MRSMAGLMLAFGLLTVGPAAAQSDLSALRGKARMPITMTIEGEIARRRAQHAGRGGGHRDPRRARLGGEPR